MPAVPFAQTVRGPVPVSELGVVLPHEHLLIENRSFVEPDGEGIGSARTGRSET